MYDLFLFDFDILFFLSRCLFLENDFFFDLEDLFFLCFVLQAIFCSFCTASQSISVLFCDEPVAGDMVVGPF